jgi:PAS domain S-box-containing protein
MKDQHKTKAQLISELEQLRKTLSECERAAKTHDQLEETSETKMRSPRDSGNRYQNMIDAAQEGIWIVDTEATTTFVNDQLARMLGYTAEEMLRRPVFDFVHEADRQETRLHLERGRQGLKEQQDFRFRRKDGSSVWAMISTTPLFDDNGTFEGGLAMLIDVSDRKRAELALRESETKFRALAETAAAAIFIYRGLNFLYVNPTTEAHTGYSREELLLKTSFLEVVHPEFRELVKERALARQRGELVPRRYEFKILTKKGETRWLDAAASSVEYEGQPAAVGIAFDITDRKRAEEALRESEGKFRVLAQTAGSAILIYQDSKLIYVNPFAVAMTGYSEQEQLSMDFWEIIHPDHRAMVRERGMARLRGEAVPARYEIKILTKSGGERWLDFSACEIEFQGKPSVLGTALDITERKRAEEALHKSQSRLEHVLSSSPAIVYSLRPKGDEFVPEWVSESITRLTGYTISEALGVGWWVNHLHPGDRDRVLAELPSLFSGDRVVLEYRFQHKDGGYHWLHDELRLLRDELGNPVEAIGSWADVTERREAEAALRDSEERFRTVVNSMNDVVFTLDRQHRCSGLFGRWPEGFDLKREDAIGKTATEILGAKAARVHEEATARALRGEQVVYEWSLPTDRGRLHFQNSLSPIRNQIGEITGLVGVGRDITERKQAEERIHFQASLLDQVRNAVIATDLENKVVFWNSFAETLYQWKKDEALGRNIFELIVPDAGRTMSEAMVSSLEQTGHWEGEFVACRKDGSTFPAYVHDATLKGATGEIVGYVGVSTDLSERKRLDHALWESEARFQSFMRHLPGYAWIKNIDGSYAFLNSLLQETLSNHQEDWRGRTDIELFPPETAAQFLINDRIVLTTRRELQVVETWMWKGEVRHALVTKFPSFDEQGELVLVAGISIDITDLRNAEHEVRSQKEILQTIFDHIPVMIRFRDKEGRLKLVNREWERTLGWSLNEIESTGLDLFAELYPDPEYRQYVLNFIAASTGEFTDLKIRAKDGRVIDAVFANVHLEDGTNIGIGRDITARKRVEDDLRKQKEILQSIFDHAPVMIGFFGGDGRPKLLNQEWERWRGWTLEEIQKQNVDLLAEGYPDAQYRQQVLNFFATSNGEWTDLRTKLRDGRVVEATWAVVHLSDGTSIGIGQDITERKRAEERLRHQAAQLSALHEIELEISAESDLARVLELVTRRAAESQNATHCSVYIFDRERSELAIAASLDSKFIGVRLREGEGIAGRVVATGEAQAIVNYSTWEGRAGFLEGTPLGSALAVPLKWQHVVIGVISLARRPGEDPFTAEDADFLEQIAGVSAIAIHQATLFEDVQEAHKRLQVLAHRLIDAQEAERKKLARELHDRIGQALTAVQINLQCMPSTPDGAYRLEESLAIIEDAIKQAHDLSLELRPSLLDDLGLVAALRWYVDRLARRSKLLRCFNVDLPDMRVAPEIETACFRIAQESLTNVVRHARAMTVWVELKSNNSDLQLIIRDDGRGFAMPEVIGRRGTNLSLGLQGMRERAAALGGLVEILSGPGQGTEVRVSFPLKDAIPSSKTGDEA